MSCSSPSTTTYTVPTVTTIQATECIGNSLNTINANYQSLKNGITTTQNYVSDQLAYLSCLINNTSNFKNKLINAQGLINQRSYVSGTATTGSNQYTLDRWRVVTSGQNLTFSTSQNIVTFNAPVGGIEQVIEGQNIESGDYILSWTGTATATVNGSPVVNGGSITLTGGSNTTVRFINGTFSLPQLEKGTVPTTFEYRFIGTELHLCQRYYELLYSVWSVAKPATAGYLQYFHRFKQQKRTTPTVGTYNVTTNMTYSATIRNDGVLIASTNPSDGGTYLYSSFSNTPIDAEL